MTTRNENARHPDSTFSTEYPYNQATVTRGGHEMHINDAPGKESLKIAHTKGTYVEIENNGRWVQVITEKCYSYIIGSLTQTVDGHIDIKVGGNQNLNIDGHSYETIAKTKRIGIGEDLIDGVGGNRSVHTIKDKYERIGENFVCTVKNDYRTAIINDKITSVGGNRQDNLQGDWSATVSGAVDMQVSGDYRITCKNFTVNAAESVTITTGSGNVTVDSAGAVTVKGTAKILIDGQAEVEMKAGSTITLDASGNVIINGSQVRLND